MKTIRNSFGKLTKNAKITLFGVPVSIFTLCFCCFALLVFTAMVQPREFSLKKPDYTGIYSTDKNEAVISFSCNKIDSVKVNDTELSKSDFKQICGDGLKVNLNEGENIFKVTPNDPDNEKAKERTIKITYTTKEEAPAVTEEPKAEEPTPTPIEEPKEVKVVITDLMSKELSELATMYNVPLNSVGNFIFEDDNFRIVAEPARKFTTVDGKYQVEYLSYPGSISVALKKLPECKADSSILDVADKALNLVSLDGSKKGNPTNPQAGINLGGIVYGNYPLSYEVGVNCFTATHPEVTLRIKE